MRGVREVVDLQERDFRLFSRSDLYDRAGHSLILPETRSLPAIEVRDEGSGVKLRALGLVGYLPLTERITLNIVPKFPNASLWYMLEVAERYNTTVLPVLRHYARSTEKAPHQLLVRAFCYFLRQLSTSGMWRGYKRENYEGYYQPKPHFGRTMARYVSRGDELRTSSEVWRFSQDLPPTRFLKSACMAFVRLVPRAPEWRDERNVIVDVLASLDRVDSAEMRPGDLPAVEQVPVRVREAYRGALSAYAILLGYTDIGFQYEAGGSVMPSFLFRLDDVFESFVRNVCREGLRSRGVRIADGNIHRNQLPLFMDTTRFPTKPDLLCRIGAEVVGIGEVKYKPRLEEADRYQVISHVTASKSPIGFWVSPAGSAADVGLAYVGQLPTGAKFYHYQIDLAQDLQTEAMRMVEALSGLLLPVEEGAN